MVNWSKKLYALSVNSVAGPVRQKRPATSLRSRVDAADNNSWRPIVAEVRHVDYCRVPCAWSGVLLGLRTPGSTVGVQHRYRHNRIALTGEIYGSGTI